MTMAPNMYLNPWTDGAREAMSSRALGNLLGGGKKTCRSGLTGRFFFPLKRLSSGLTGSQ
jgi:hypothetical protein